MRTTQSRFPSISASLDPTHDDFDVFLRCRAPARQPAQGCLESVSSLEAQINNRNVERLMVGHLQMHRLIYRHSCSPLYTVGHSAGLYAAVPPPLDTVHDGIVT